MKILFRQCLRGIIYLLLSSFALPIHAQVSVSGLITDSSNMPIPGVNILLKNTTTGTTTNFEGRFKLEASSSDTLVVSYIGFKTQELAVREQVFFTIDLTPEANTLAAVLINAGYYTVKDKERTGSISRITAKEIENQPVNNPLEAMQGRMAGVEVVQNSGVPGGGFEVRIRGQNSIMAGNEPLYIIDGVPYDSRTLGSGNSSGGIIPKASISPLNAINPEAIASIEVLKDADATAIYGSRGANGVVLITTKKGTAGKAQYNFSSHTGIAYVAKKPTLLTTAQYLEMRREAFANDAVVEYPSYAYDVNGTWDEDRYTDWQKELIGYTANTHKVQGSVSGGSQQVRFLLNGMYQNETSVFPGKFNYDRITINSNFQYSDKDDKLKLNFSANYTLEDNFLPGSDLGYSAMSLAPNAPALYDDEGVLNWEDGTWSNPLAQFENKYKNKIHTLFSSLSLTYQLTAGLNLKLNSGYTLNQLKDHVTAPHTAFNPSWGLTSANSMVTTNEGNKNTWLVEPQLNWEKKWREGVLKVLLGGTFQKQQFNQYGLYGMGFPTNSFITNLSAATIVQVNNEVSTQYNTQSWFARVNYAYKQKVFLNLTGRRDGSSRFGSGNKYGNFGAVGAAWLFSEDINLSWLSFGKLRGSYGVTGNDQIGDYQYLQTYTINDNFYDGNIGLQPARLYNPDFQWEKNKKSEVALEMSFLKNKIALSVAYYNNRSSNQLINYALPASTGFSSILANLDAKIENKGWEFELSGKLMQTEKFNWTSSFNLSLSRNKLLKFPGLENSSYANKYVIGHPVSIAKLYQLQGVNPQTGIFEFKDYNNDGQLTAVDDRGYIADLTPKYYGGFSNSLHYKNWDMDVLFQFVKKEGYNQYRTTEPVGTMSNQSVAVLDRWQQPGDMATMQRFTSGANSEAYTAYYQFTQSNGIISNTSFIRLKSIALAYTLTLSKKSHSTCRLFVSGQNLFTWTKFKAGDPEQVDGYLPPLVRATFGFQLNL